MSLSVQNSNNLVSFCGFKNFLRGVKNLTKEEKMLEYNRGRMAGLDAKKRSIEECKEIIIRETLCGNFEFLKGFNNIIGKDMSKKAYEKIAKLQSDTIK